MNQARLVVAAAYHVRRAQVFDAHMSHARPWPVDPREHILNPSRRGPVYLPPEPENDSGLGAGLALCAIFCAIFWAVCVGVYLAAR